MKKVLLLLLLSLLIFQPANAAKNLGKFGAKGYEKFIESREYGKALSDLSKIKEEKQTAKEKALIKNLNIFIEVDKSKPGKSNALLGSEEDMDPEVVRESKTLYRAAQKEILENRPIVAQDVLIHILYIYPDNHKAKTLLDKAFGLKKGDYKVEDKVKKYTSRAEHFFFGGNFLLALQDLEVLAIIDKSNPQVFERIGSTHYKMNEKKKAVEGWTKAMFLDPENKVLESFIAQTKEEINFEALKRQKESSKERRKTKKVEIKDPQVMGVYAKQSQAYDFMKQLKARGLTKVAIEENDKGKWVVKVSRSELQAVNRKGK